MTGDAGGGLRETAWAKLNLALHVRERLPDGYHRIETVFAFVADGDRLTAEPAAALRLSVEGPFAAGLSAGPDNLVLRAAAALRATCGVAAGADLRLAKRLPVASGIGGGSADAAAALRLLSRLWNLGDAPLARIAGELGADVPACLESRASLGIGRGDRLRPLSSTLAGTPVLLVNPGVPVPTGPVFAGWDGIDRGGIAPVAPLATDPAWRNDLAPEARRLVPAIGEALELLERQPGAAFVRMSGSGATCFALFYSDAARDAAADAVAAARPDWWRLASALR